MKMKGKQGREMVNWMNERLDGLLVGKEINFKEDFIQWLPGPGNGNKFLLMK